MASVKQKKYVEVHASSRITENNITNADMSKDNLSEKMLDKNNLNQVFKKVKSNKGTGGMKVEHLLPLSQRKQPVTYSIHFKEGKYDPNPVKRVGVPKEDKGKIRRLGISTNSSGQSDTTGNSLTKY